MLTSENQQHEQYVFSSALLTFTLVDGTTDGRLADTEAFFDSPLATWISHDDCQDNFNARLARNASILEAEHSLRDLTSLMFASPHTQGTSEVVHVQSEYDLDSMASDNIPPLTRGNSIVSSSSKTSSGMASAIDGGCVLSTEDGILTLPATFQPDADLRCPFQILDCRQTFSDVIEFKIHVFSHFRGEPLPHFAPCFICGRLFLQTDGDDRALAWNNVLSHMAYDHYRGTNEEVRIRSDVAVLRYMWGRQLISDAQFTRVQLLMPEARPAIMNIANTRMRQIPEAPMAPEAPVPTEIQQHFESQSVGFQNEPFTVTAGRRQDRRQLGQLRARVRGNL